MNKIHRNGIKQGAGMNNIRDNHVIQGASTNKIMYSLLIFPMGDPRRIHCTLLYGVMALCNAVSLQLSSIMCRLKETKQIKRSAQIHKYTKKHVRHNYLYKTNIKQ